MEKFTDVIEELKARFSRKSAEERAFILLKLHFDLIEKKWRRGEDMADVFSDSFLEWFHDPRNARAIAWASERLMEMYEPVAGGEYQKRAKKPII